MTDWITSIIDQWGALGVAFLMVVENVFPPIPSEVVLPLAGAEAARGNISLVAATLGATLGAIIGTLPYYYVGRWLGLERVRDLAGRHGRWLTMSPSDVDRADRWFDRQGKWAVLIGRMVPAVRTVISIPAGITGMPLTQFMIFTGIGTFAWSALLVGLGYALGSSDTVAGWINPIGNLVLVGALLIYIGRVATFTPDGKREAE